MDRVIEKIIKKEKKRQKACINLIASENIVSSDTLRALGSVFTNKYAEGYPRHRYYAGTAPSDELELEVQKRALKLFNLSSKKWGVNVQAYSGSPANLAIFYALVPFGEKIMGMGLDMGGHLSHGQKVSITGKLWKQVRFNLSPKTELLDYDSIKKIALKEKPKLVIAGFTAYPRIINFKKFREICDKINAIFMVDMSHFAGLVAGRVYPSPFPFAHVVMTTTHKTLRGPRGAIIFARKIDLNFFRKDISQNISIFEAINKAIFPGIQGGPHLNNIAAIGVALNEARKSSFRKYASMVVKNARVLAREFKNLKWRVISGGTDTHLILLDVSLLGLSGGEAQRILENHGIIVNKNMIPFDSRKPTDPSGIRIGTAFVTSAGKKERDMIKIARLIDGILRKKNDNRRRKNS